MTSKHKLIFNCVTGTITFGSIVTYIYALFADDGVLYVCGLMGTGFAGYCLMAANEEYLTSAVNDQTSPLKAAPPQIASSSSGSYVLTVSETTSLLTNKTATKSSRAAHKP